jgi:hypothetical protein
MSNRLPPDAFGAFDDAALRGPEAEPPAIPDVSRFAPPSMRPAAPPAGDPSTGHPGPVPPRIPLHDPTTLGTVAPSTTPRHSAPRTAGADQRADSAAAAADADHAPRGAPWTRIGKLVVGLAAVAVIAWGAMSIRTYWAEGQSEPALLFTLVGLFGIVGIALVGWFLRRRDYDRPWLVLGGVCMFVGLIVLPLSPP